MTDDMDAGQRRELIRSLEEQARNGGKRDLAKINKEYSALHARAFPNYPYIEPRRVDPFLPPWLVAMVGLLAFIMIRSLTWPQVKAGETFGIGKLIGGSRQAPQQSDAARPSRNPTAWQIPTVKFRRLGR